MEFTIATSRHTRRALLIAAAAAGVAGPLGRRGASAQTPVAGDPLPVVVTFSVLADLVQRVGGDAIEVRTIVEPGVDAHTFEAAPADAIALAEAPVIFANGLGFEPWLAQLAEGSGEPLEIVTVTDGLELLSGGHAHGEDGHEDEQQHEGADGHAGEGEFDPHVWHDVRNAIAMTGAIRDALSRVDPENAAYYAANADAAIADLEALDAWVVEQVSAIPEDRRKLVTAHDTFGYFAHRYGFGETASVQGLSTEAGEPSAMEIAALVEEIRAAGVPVIFVENVSNPALVESVAAEAGVTVGPPLYTDALGLPGSDGDSYDAMMRHNVEAIASSLTR